MHNPLLQFFDKVIYKVQFAGWTFGLTSCAVAIITSSVIILTISFLYYNRSYIVPDVFEYTMESAFLFVHNLLLKQTGHKGLKYISLVWTIFLMVLVNNLLGLVPGFFTSTSQFAVTGFLALTVFVSVIIIGFMEQGWHFLSLFAPSSISKLVWPLFMPIELVAFFIRPVSLCVRLCMNMIVGHMVLKIFAGFVVMWPVSGILVIPILMALILMEIGVACMQAYVFTLLTCIYLKDAVKGH